MWFNHGLLARIEQALGQISSMLGQGVMKSTRPAATALVMAATAVATRPSRKAGVASLP
jgi:hypothetical protein